MQLVLRKWFSQNLKPGQSTQDKRRSLIRTVLNALCFQMGWFSCVLGGNAIAVPVTLAILVWHRVCFANTRAEWWLIVGLGATGLLLDSALTAFGIFSFDVGTGPLVPIWLLCLWLLFATTLCHSLSWLQYRLSIAVLLGAIAGPSSYFAGSELASVTLAEPVLISLAIIGVCWAIIFPCSLLLARRCQK